MEEIKMDNGRVETANKMLNKLRSWAMELDFFPYMFPKPPYLSDWECKKLAAYFPFTWRMLREAFPRARRTCSVDKMEGGYRYKLYEGRSVIYQLDVRDKVSEEDIQVFMNTPEVLVSKVARPQGVTVH
jgi:hypothetical protein